ncbi:hypothetical protein [Methanopyrus sp. KOL6]|uniref:hypothetical protein n=1 Tax=Methanopyrus sp. KOL6 TaxID=1937004 RepID=UPI0012F8694B|nr:hypothetical protein [Methanopyrus sp. KOL6]
MLRLSEFLVFIDHPSKKEVPNSEVEVARRRVEQLGGKIVWSISGSVRKYHPDVRYVESLRKEGYELALHLSPGYIGLHRTSLATGVPESKIKEAVYDALRIVDGAKYLTACGPLHTALFRGKVPRKGWKEDLGPELHPSVVHGLGKAAAETDLHLLVGVRSPEWIKGILDELGVKCIEGIGIDHYTIDDERPEEAAKMVAEGECSAVIVHPRKDTFRRLHKFITCLKRIQ